MIGVRLQGWIIVLLRLLVRHGRPHWGLWWCIRLTRWWPESGRIWRLQGELLLAGLRFEAALTAFEQADARLVIDPAVWHGMGRALAGMWRFDDAVSYYRRALEVMPLFLPLRIDLIRVLQERGCHDEVLVLVKRLVADHPGHVVVMGLQAALFEAWGSMDAALSWWYSMLERWPDHPDILYNLSRLHRFVGFDDPVLLCLERRLQQVPVVIEEEVVLCFALAKAYEDLGEWERAFDFFERGNRCKRSVLRYDPREVDVLFESVQRIFHPAFLASHRGVGYGSRIPIFIVGMPRSGTTLLEQILASHPLVRGGGERYTLHRLTRLSGGYPAGVVQLDRVDWEVLGRSYVHEIVRAFPDGMRVTDKMPHNFLHIGFLALALPEAVILHCCRDPVDTCLSCYRVLFSAEHNYAYDLGELGHYYRAYVRLMEHWHLALPGRILDIQYERLVADPVSEVRKILDHCCLEWDERCLRFHETRRVVETASRFQVRQPMYSHAVGRWRRHTDRLVPLFEALNGKEIY